MQGDRRGGAARDGGGCGEGGEGGAGKSHRGGCRRAERHVWKRVAELDAGERSRVESVARFLNRLSDFLFVAARGAAAQDVVYDVSANVRRKRREKGRGDDE